MSDTDPSSFLFVREEYRVFIDLTYLSSYLVLRRFFRPLSTSAAPETRPLTLGSYSEVPVMRQTNQYKRDDKTAKYYDGLFFLLLFVMGSFFSALVHRIAY